MLVDNAIVVVEATLVRVNKGEQPADAVVSVVNQTKWPLLGGTVVGILAFSAIGFSPDNTGEYAGSLFWTMVISLMFSWIVAIWLTPYYCTLMLKKPKILVLETKENIFARAYRALLKRAVRFRWVTIAIVLVLFVVAMGSFSMVKSGFFPLSTRNQFVIDFTLPQGSSIEQTTADLAEVSDWVRKLDGVTGTNGVVGGGHSRFMLTYGSESPSTSYGQILVDVGSYLLINDLRKTIQTHMDNKYLSATVKVWQFVLGPGGGSEIGVRFSGPDPIKLRQLSEKTKSILTDNGAIAVKDNWSEMVKVVRPIINETNASRVGLSQGDISKAIAAHFDGKVIGAFRDKDQIKQIIFRPYAENRNDVKDIRNVRIFSNSVGQYIPITQVVDGFDIVFENAKLRKYNRAFAIEAQADSAPDKDLNVLFSQIKPQIEAIDLPDGYSLIWRGQYGDSQAASGGLASTLPFGIGAMIVVVFLLFNAIRQPVIIWLIVPLAVIGVVFGLIITGTPMEFMAILGVLSLMGMLIKNAMVLIDQTDIDIAEGRPRMTAVIDAAVGRMRPVVLGVLTTVLGVIPLLWDPFFKSLAVVIIFGLSFATILTLIVAPALYAIFFRIKNDEI